MSGSPSVETSIVVELSAVSGRYGTRHAVGPVTASLSGPGIFWIVGPNGSGKSTLLRLLAGLKRPAAGRVQWRREGRELAAADLRTEAGLAAPEIQLYRDLSARENLEFLGRLRGVREPRDTARATLRSAGLGDRENDRPGDLSSGLRQRLRLTTAWLAEPAFLLLDEPSSNLDPEGRAWLWGEIRRRAERALCVVSTNRLEEVGSGEPSLDLGARNRR